MAKARKQKTGKINKKPVVLVLRRQESRICRLMERVALLERALEDSVRTMNEILVTRDRDYWQSNLRQASQPQSWKWTVADFLCRTRDNLQKEDESIHETYGEACTYPDGHT